MGRNSRLRTTGRDCKVYFDSRVALFMISGVKEKYCVKWRRGTIKFRMALKRLRVGYHDPFQPYNIR